MVDHTNSRAALSSLLSLTTMDEEEQLGLLSYQEVKKTAQLNTPKRNRNAVPGAWRYAAIWAFFTFFAIFFSLLVVKVIENDFIHSTIQSIVSPLKVPASVVVSTSKKAKALPTSDLPFQSKSSPNFVFLLADDIGFGLIKNADFPFAPYLTSLAKQGIVMSNYYTQEICAPSRASLLTGRYPSRIGAQYGQFGATQEAGLSLDEKFLPEALRDFANYKSYALGKWNLGHHSPNYLPTARGFDYYLGYVSTENTYWTKSMAEYDGMQDFMEANTTHYAPYNGDDLTDYSTFLYRDHAVKIIESHNYESNPMFLYVALQAAHPPFQDISTHLTGLESDSFTAEQWKLVHDFTDGSHRQQYLLSIILMDQAVKDIVESLARVKQSENTYIIFASDNGGCPLDGGNNYGLRGSKGTLFEGGTKVDAFVYHPQFASLGIQGTYSGLMHVSDWFPTILHLAGNKKYRPANAWQRIEGYNHVYAWLDRLKNGDESSGEKVAVRTGPRDYMVYNYYGNVESMSFTEGINASIAVRDRQYKLVHTFTNTSFDGWHNIATDAVPDDDSV